MGALLYCLGELKALKGQKLSWDTYERFYYVVETIKEAAEPSLLKDAVLEKFVLSLDDYREILIRREVDWHDEQMAKAGQQRFVRVVDENDETLGYRMAWV